MEDRILGRRYRITEKIGDGGMAVVYKAQDEVLGRTVAVKVMHSQYASDPTFAARFRQEAQAAANLQSPYIVNIYDWGHDDDTYYIVMEYVRGIDLKTAIRERGAIDPRKVAEIAAQVCGGLAVAHGYDVIHRDIKPHNIMVQPDGSVKIMDFGIARAGNTTMTQTGSVLGTAHYVSPEQAQGLPLTPATDIYSLGVVMYEAATGKLPFDAEEAVAVALKQVNEQPIPPSQLNPKIDPQLEAIILRAMAKNPHDRFASATEMRTYLEDYLAGRSGSVAGKTAVLAGAGAAVAGAAAADGTQVMPQVGKSGTQVDGWSPDDAPRSLDMTDDKKKNKKWIWIVVAVVAILAIGFGVAWATGLIGGNNVTVPNVTGMEAAAATQKLEDSDFKVTTSTSQYSDKVAAGRVISQDPRGNTKAKKGSEVKLVVSKGKKPAEVGTVPDVSGLTESEARSAIQKAGFNPSKGDDVYSDTVNADLVAKQDPPAEESLAKGSTVTYNMSLGKKPDEKVTVPDVKGESQSQAINDITAKGLSYKVVEDYSDSVDKGNVISQSPSAGSSVNKGTTVTITVSKGSQQPASVSVPSVVGMDQSSAESQLKAAGFKVNATTGYSSTVDKGNVISQNPTGSAPKGSTITIVVSQGPNDSATQ